MQFFTVYLLFQANWKSSRSKEWHDNNMHSVLKGGRQKMGPTGSKAQISGNDESREGRWMCEQVSLLKVRKAKTTPPKSKPFAEFA